MKGDIKTMSKETKPATTPNYLTKEQTAKLEELYNTLLETLLEIARQAKEGYPVKASLLAVIKDFLRDNGVRARNGVSWRDFAEDAEGALEDLALPFN
jgi:hypothetical protein